MKIAEFQTKLNEKLTGKDYDGYSWMSSTTNAVQELLEEIGLPTEKIYYKQYCKGNSFSIVFDNKATLFTIEVKKKRGQYNKGYFLFKGNYDWTFGDITIFSDADTVEDAWGRMMKSYANATMRDKTRDERAIEVIMYAMKNFEMSSWDVCDFFKYISERRYTLGDAAEKRLKAGGTV